MRKRGFTLIELLVVIAVIALLMAILLPTLHRARRQAKAVGCRSNLRQWGTLWASWVDENNGYFPGCNPQEQPSKDRPDGWPGGWGWGWWGPYWVGYSARDWYAATEGIRLCPMATKPRSPTGAWEGWMGGTFLAWGRFAPKEDWPSEFAWAWEKSYGTYGVNDCVFYWYDWHMVKPYPYSWRTPHVKGASNIPVQLDCCVPSGLIGGRHGPPERDAVPTPSLGRVGDPRDYEFCMNRHDGGINGLFMDWSVRKVGLKELWTLKWHREFDTRNLWTKAGGVKPEDWPQWMRRFKDY